MLSDINVFHHANFGFGFPITDPKYFSWHNVPQQIDKSGTISTVNRCIKLPKFGRHFSENVEFNTLQMKDDFEVFKINRGIPIDGKYSFLPQ